MVIISTKRQIKKSESSQNITLQTNLPYKIGCVSVHYTCFQSNTPPYFAISNCTSTIYIIVYYVNSKVVENHQYISTLRDESLKRLDYI